MLWLLLLLFVPPAALALCQSGVSPTLLNVTCSNELPGVLIEAADGSIGVVCTGNPGSPPAILDATPLQCPAGGIQVIGYDSSGLVCSAAPPTITVLDSACYEIASGSTAVSICSGETGPQGVQGNAGPQGPQGIQGLLGPPPTVALIPGTGCAAIQGLGTAVLCNNTGGPQGIQGLQGLQGPIGLNGSVGPQGLQGVQGPAGYNGSEGPQGLQGLQGIQGLQGPAGSNATVPQNLAYSAVPTFAGLVVTGASGAAYFNSSGTLQSSGAMQNGQLLIGSSTGGPLAATLTGTPNQVIVTNAANSVTLSLPQSVGSGSTPTFASETLSAATNQLTLGTGTTTTVSATAPAANRTITLPDPGANANFVLTQGTQTVAGATTFSSALTVNPTTNQLVLGVTHTTTISATAPAASVTVTIPDPGASANFVLTQGTQTIAGNTTFSSTAPSTSTTTGGVVMDGGLGVAKTVYCSDIARTAPAIFYNNNVGSPTGTVSTTQVMMGLGSTWTYTPKKTGILKITMQFGATVTLTTAYIEGNSYYGTGTAPVNGAVPSGTILGRIWSADTPIASIGDTQLQLAYITGLSVGIAYWFDIGVASSSASSTASIANCLILVEEF